LFTCNREWECCVTLETLESIVFATERTGFIAWHTPVRLVSISRKSVITLILAGPFRVRAHQIPRIVQAVQPAALAPLTISGSARTARIVAIKLRHQICVANHANQEVAILVSTRFQTKTVASFVVHWIFDTNQCDRYAITERVCIEDVSDLDGIRRWHNFAIFVSIVIISFNLANCLIWIDLHLLGPNELH